MPHLSFRDDGVDATNGPLEEIHDLDLTHVLNGRVTADLCPSNDQ